MIVAEERLAGEDKRGHAKGKGEGSSSQLVATGREDQVLAKAETCARQKLTP